MNAIDPVEITTSGSFSRASTKWHIGSTGALRLAPINVAAFQYDPADLTLAPLPLLEPAATNLVLRSTDFGHAAWVKSAVSVVSGAVAGITTNATLSKIAEDTSSGVHGISQTLTKVGALVTYTYSAVVKAGERSLAGVYVGDGATGVAFAEVDLLTGAVAISQLAGGFSAATASTVKYGAGQYLCSITATSNTATAIVAGIVLRDGVGADSYLGDGVSGLYVGDAQLEVGTRTTSRMPTVDAIATRAADVITGTGLIYSNAPEVAPADYAGVTTYDFGVEVGVPGLAGEIAVYRSKAPLNLGNPPASSPTWWEYRGTVYQTYSTTKTYALGERVLDPTRHLVRTSLVAGNLGQQLTDATKWSSGKVTNRWAPFDNVVGTAVTLDRPLHMLVVPGKLDSVGLLNVQGTSASVAMIDPSNLSTVFSKVGNLSNDAEITDYDLYFFEDEETVSDLFIDSLPPYYTGIVGISLIGPSAALGVAKFGTSVDCGGTEYGARVGYISYAKKKTDEDGNFSVTPGASSKRMTLTTEIPASRVDKVARLMTRLDSIPTVYIGAGNTYSSMIQFAFTKEFEVEIAYLNHSLCSFQFEGLI